MEADWEFEIGGQAPVIDAHWSGFIDLRLEPERVSELNECRQVRGLAEALLRLNGPTSPVWTSKADVFTPEPVDPDEMDAERRDASQAIACYIDLLPRHDETWTNPASVEEACREICAHLVRVKLRRCRIDVVIRRALMRDLELLGVTAYITACGATLDAAKARLSECLDAFTQVLAPGRSETRP